MVATATGGAVTAPETAGEKFQNQPDPREVPRYCGISTFARLHSLNSKEVEAER